ncbi:MAG: chorismate mutase [Stellaceae bacterium]
MSSTVPNLADLRRRIDVIDAGLHELLIERAEIVGAVAASKTASGTRHDAAFYQPAREAEILRRLARRHRGALPFASLARIWRELLAATVGLETRFAVAVFAPPGGAGCWDLARDHYGSQTPMAAHDAAGGVINAVSTGRASIGVLPMPRESDIDPWWRHLLPSESHPQVVARLPFGGRGNARGDCGDALAIGYGVQQETGADRTLFVTLSGAPLGRVRLLRLLESADLACMFCAAAGQRDGTFYLIELDGFVPLADPRLARLRAELGISHHCLSPLGGYAVPLCSVALSDRTAKAEPV